jgi:hypothetical protein
LPQTLKEQKDVTKKLLKKGQISIKISKPKLTINGFEIEKEEEKKPVVKKRVSSSTAKSIKTKEGGSVHELVENLVGQIDGGHEELPQDDQEEFQDQFDYQQE